MCRGATLDAVEARNSQGQTFQLRDRFVVGLRYQPEKRPIQRDSNDFDLHAALAGKSCAAHCRISVDVAGYHSSDRQIRPRLNDLCLQSLGLEKAPICGDIEIGKSDASARHRNLYLEQTTLGPQL